jgi:hypothetical protein
MLRGTGEQPSAGAGRATEARSGISDHRRFTLREVTFGGLPVGGATVDVWEDAGGAERWSVRLLMPLAHPLREGVLAGTAVGGQRFSGTVHLADTTAGPRRGREVLAELHGDGPLGVEEPGPADAGTIRRTGPRR